MLLAEARKHVEQAPACNERGQNEVNHGIRACLVDNAAAAVLAEDTKAVSATELVPLKQHF